MELSELSEREVKALAAYALARIASDVLKAYPYFSKEQMEEKIADVQRRNINHALEALTKMN